MVAVAEVPDGAVVGVAEPLLGERIPHEQLAGIRIQARGGEAGDGRAEPLAVGSAELVVEPGSIGEQDRNATKDGNQNRHA